MNRKLLAVGSLCLVVLVVVGCASIGAWTTPAELQSVPARQAMALEVIIEKIENKREGWTQSSTLLDVLKADKAAWDQLDRYYNGE